MTLFSLKNVDYHDIETNDTCYRISDDDDDDELVKSIKIFGLLNFPLLQQKEKRYIIISGFKRVKACIKAGISLNPARVTDCDDPIVCAKIAVTENSYKRELSVIEKVRCISLMKKSHDLISKTDIFYKNTCEVLGIPYATRYVDMLVDASRLPLSTLMLVNDDFLSLTVVSDLLQFSPEAINLIEKIFIEFKASVSKQKELITLINEVSRIYKMDHGWVLKELYSYILDIKHINPDKNYLLKSARDFLFKKRYPNIASMHEKYIETVSRLKFPEGVRFIPPENFEGQSYQLCLNFKRLEVLKTQIRQVEKISLQKELEMIMNREYQ